MNPTKIAAALQALAEAFLEDNDQPANSAKGRGKAKTAAEPAQQQAIQPEAVAPVVPSITKDQLNKVVLAVAAKGRDKAEAILSKFGAKNTVTLPQEQWQAVYDAFEEEMAKIDAAAVQVAQASLV